MAVALPSIGLNPDCLPPKTASVIPRGQWSTILFKEKRAIKLEEHHGHDRRLELIHEAMPS
jgi:hypothetical protein